MNTAKLSIAFLRMAPGRVLLLACVFQSAFPAMALAGDFDFRAASAHNSRSPAAALPPPSLPTATQSQATPLPVNALAEPSALSNPAATPSALRSAFPDAALHRMDPATFNAYVSTHQNQGRLLTSAELSALASATPARNGKRPKASRAQATNTVASVHPCDSLPDSLRAACWDSLAAFAAKKRDSAAPSSQAKKANQTPAPRALAEMQAKEAAKRDSLARARGDSAAAKRDTLAIEGRGDAYDESDEEPESWVIGEPGAKGADQNLHEILDDDDIENQNWFIHLVTDFGDGDGGGGGGWGGDELAAVIYVVVGVVVVGAFLIYGIQTLVELAANTEDYPVFQEAGMRLSYSGKALQNQTGSADMYRDAYLAGVRYAVGFDRPGMDLGLAFEGGYIDVWLSPLNGQGRSFDFQGGYLVAGPMLRFGSYDPLCFSLEFLNGTSGHESIGWISKSRMTLSGKVGRHATFGGHLGAVFYDLEFLDGLGWRRGNFNRDLSLISGLDVGWQF